MSPPPRFNVLGTAVSALSLADARDQLVGVRGRQRVGYVCATAVHGISEARQDPAFRALLNRAWLNVPDGMPLVWLGRHHGHRQVTRVYGPDLMAAVCDTGRAVGLTHYLYGGKEGVAPLLADKLRARFPGIRIVGTFTPPFRPLDAIERSALLSDVAARQPDIIWVGLGTPKQERFAAEFAPLLDAGTLVTVGAAFDFHSGLLRQAPRWIQRSGFEWLFRLSVEPRRLWRRYILNNPLFILRSLLQLTGLKKYPLE